MKNHSQVSRPYFDDNQAPASGAPALLGENRRLRRRLLELASENVGLRKEVTQLHEQAVDLRRAHTRDREEQIFLEHQMADIEAETERCCERSAELGDQAIFIASLYAATACLHETLDRQEVLEVIHDIVVNLVGSREVAVFEAGAELSLVFSSGLEPASLEGLTDDSGLVARVAASGEPYFAGLSGAGALGAGERRLTAAIPLKVDGRVTGVVTVFRLLPQKDGTLSALDHKLLDLLADQAGNSLYCTALNDRFGSGLVH